VADVVGLGKSYIGAAIVKHFERTDHARALILCPAPLTDMWERYNEVYQLNARVLSMGMLREEDDGAVNMLLEDVLYKDRDFVLIDESHNLRHRDTIEHLTQPAENELHRGRALFYSAGMKNNQSVSVLDRLLEPITRCLNPESARALVELRADPVAQARIAELAEKCNQGEITPEERQEYETYVRVGNIIAILQAKARLLLRKQTPS